MKPIQLIIGFCLILAVSCARPKPPPPADRDEAFALYAAAATNLPPRPADPARLVEWENGRTLLRKSRFILSLDPLDTNLLARFSHELHGARQAFEAAASSRAPRLVRGQREEGYHSEIDDSFQPFLRFLPSAYRKGDTRPLLVFLHGYSPDLNLINWQGIPQSLLDFAEKEGYLVCEPFGRSNTDFQGIGEQDVLRVIAEMGRRYGVDSRRIILIGYSMGATGAWSLAARHPGLFAGALMFSGRGDYYFWHGLVREEVPAWKRRMIDADFAGSMPENLKDMPLFCAHGAYDDLVPVQEARTIVRIVRAVNPGLVYMEIPYGGHGIWDDVFFTRECREWLLACRRAEPGAPTAFGRQPGVKGAFLDPFVFVHASERGGAPSKSPRFKKAVNDWLGFSKAMPRLARETNLSSNILGSCNVFLFGEPESSALIRRVLEGSPVRVTPDAFIVGGRPYPRRGNGLWLVQPSPWNPERLAVVQCGIPWGDGLAENHKYDLLPDYIVYTARQGEDGCNTALGAGFFDAQWRLMEQE